MYALRARGAGTLNGYPRTVDVDAHPERRRWEVVVAVVAVLVVANIMSNRLLPAWAYVPWNLLVAVAVVALARRNVSHEAMGFHRWRRGAAWGVALLVLTVAVLVVAVAMPAFHDLYSDRRVDGGVAAWLYHAFVRIPLGTVVLEEVAFRAVLPALFAARFGVLRGSVAASALFGLWHVLPAMNLNTVNPVMADVFGSGVGGQVAAVVFGVVGTTFAGLWWCWIRYRAGSVLATMIAHVGTNSVAYTIAYLIAGS